MAGKVYGTSRLFKICEALWDWLREQDEYRRAYANWEKQANVGSIAPFEIGRVKGQRGKSGFKLVSDPADFCNAAEPLRVELRCRRLISMLSCKGLENELKRQQKIKSRFGFYPLHDPDNPEFSRAFLRFISRSHIKGLFGFARKSVNVKNFSLQALYRAQLLGLKSKPHLPSKLRFEVNCNVNAETIAIQIKRIVSKIQHAYNLNKRKPHLDDELLVTKARMLKAMGLTRSNTRLRLFPKLANPNSPESLRKVAQRILDKAF